MHLLLAVFATLAIFASVTVANDDKRIVWHERPVKEQWGCVTTCKASYVNYTEFYRTQCAVCMDRIRNTVCNECAAAYRDGREDTDVLCNRCRHISDYDETSDFTDAQYYKDNGWNGPFNF